VQLHVQAGTFATRLGETKDSFSRFFSNEYHSNSYPSSVAQVHLLEAEQFSFEKNNQEALLSYAAAIRSACSSRFIHEQGLACELAGYHCKKNGDFSGARNYFDQAKKCYADWGSQMKVDSITQALESVQDNNILLRGPISH
jgi:hypothetical protein